MKLPRASRQQLCGRGDQLSAYTSHGAWYWREVSIILLCELGLEDGGGRDEEGSGNSRIGDTYKLLSCAIILSGQCDDNNYYYYYCNYTVVSNRMLRTTNDKHCSGNDTTGRLGKGRYGWRSHRGASGDGQEYQLHGVRLNAGGHHRNLFRGSAGR